MAFAVDLGTIQSVVPAVTWAIGYVRDPVAQYNATELRRPYWTTRYSDINVLVSFVRVRRVYHRRRKLSTQIDAFLADYPDALQRAAVFDEQVMTEAAKVSPQYVDLVSLVARQVMGAIDITVGSSNEKDGMDVKAFMKDIGTSQCITFLIRQGISCWC